MLRMVGILVYGMTLMATLGAAPAPAQSAEVTPNTYEVVVNGESFLVQEGPKPTKVESKQKPGTTYELAVFISPTQVLRLNSISLEYELPAKVADDRGRDLRVVQIKHVLGFSVALTDLGQALDAKRQEAFVKMLTKLVSDQAKQQKAEELAVTALRKLNFQGAAAQGSKIHYRDPVGTEHTALAYLLTGENFAATCVVEFRDKDGDDVKPLIKKLLNSIRSLK
jgi:hypothetical protein